MYIFNQRHPVVFLIEQKLNNICPNTNNYIYYIEFYILFIIEFCILSSVYYIEYMYVLYNRI
jgi:hypothetical protein